MAVEVNHDPVADAGGPYTSYEGEPFSLDASASSDPDLNALTFEWTLDGDVLGSPLMDSRTLWASLPDEGSYGADVEVRDGRGGSDTKASAVAVTNVAPIVSAAASGTVSLTRPLSIPATELATFTDPGVLDTTSQPSTGATGARARAPSRSRAARAACREVIRTRCRATTPSP